MEIVIPMFWTVLYPLIGLASIMYCTRSHYRQDSDQITYSAFIGTLCGLFWPVGLPYWAAANLLTRERDRAKAEDRHRMTLETAHDVIARHETRLRADRKARNDRLKRDWEQLARDAHRH